MGFFFFGGGGGVVPFNRVGQGMGGSGIPKYPK